MCSEHEDAHLKENQKYKLTYNNYLIQQSISFSLRKHKDFIFQKLYIRQYS